MQAITDFIYCLFPYAQSAPVVTKPQQDDDERFLEALWPTMDVALIFLEYIGTHTATSLNDLCNCIVLLERVTRGSELQRRGLVDTDRFEEGGQQKVTHRIPLIDAFVTALRSPYLKPLPTTFSPSTAQAEWAAATTAFTTRLREEVLWVPRDQVNDKYPRESQCTQMRDFPLIDARSARQMGERRRAEYLALLNGYKSVEDFSRIVEATYQEAAQLGWIHSATRVEWPIGKEGGLAISLCSDFRLLHHHSPFFVEVKDDRSWLHLVPYCDPQTQQRSLLIDWNAAPMNDGLSFKTGLRGLLPRLIAEVMQASQVESLTITSSEMLYAEHRYDYRAFKSTTICTLLNAMGCQRRSREVKYTVSVWETYWVWKISLHSNGSYEEGLVDHLESKYVDCFDMPPLASVPRNRRLTGGLTWAEYLKSTPPLIPPSAAKAFAPAPIITQAALQNAREATGRLLSKLPPCSLAKLSLECGALAPL